MTAGIEFDPAERDAIAAEMNISVLKRSDTAIKCVLKSANHVCLYQLDDDHQWRRLDVEGSLFIVERYLDHRNNPNRHMHRIVIINRKSLNNYTDDIIVGNKHLELTDQMIMYSNSKQATIGIWFYQKAQADDIFNLLQRIVNGEKPQPSPDRQRPKRTPKRPAKPDDQSATKPVERIETAKESAPDNSLERFFPNLKLTNGVAGHQVPESAKESMFESQAVSTMSTSPNVTKAATAFKPTAEIDAAIITASEIGIPEGAVAGSVATDVSTLASQAMQVVKGKPKSEQKRKPGARPRSSQKSTSPHTSSQALNPQSSSKAGIVTKTTSPPRPNPPSKPVPPAKANLSTKGSVSAKSNPTTRQHRQSLKASPPSKRAPGGKRGQATKGSSTNKNQARDKPDMRSVRASTASTAPPERSDTITSTTPNPQIQLLTRPKPTAESKASATIEQPGESSSGEVGMRAPPPLAVPSAPSSRSMGALNPSDTRRRVPVSSPESVRPSTPNVPIEKEVPGAPRAKQAKTPVGGAHAMHASSTMSSTGDEEKVGLRQRSMTMSGTEEETRRQLHNMSMRQAQADTLQMQEAHMFGMPGAFPFVSTELGLGQTPSMIGGGLAGPGAAPSGFTPGLHPQVAMMMQQQQHQMFMRQQFMAQQHQRQMQLQAEQAHGMVESSGNGIGSEVVGSGCQTGQVKTKEESANDLMRMLNVDRSESKKMLDKVDEKKNAESVGESIAEAEKFGELGTSGDKLDKVSFRAVVQRMLTDRRLFEKVYERYLSSQ